MLPSVACLQIIADRNGQSRFRRLDENEDLEPEFTSAEIIVAERILGRPRPLARMVLPMLT